jgi:hypothetical protein
MGVLTRELDAIQNPALGAMLIWRFVAGFDTGSTTGAGAPLPYAFLPLPMLMHEETAALLLETRTRSGIRKFTEKFMSSKEAKSDLLLVLNNRMAQMRPLSLRSIHIALGSSHVGVDLQHALLFPLSRTAPRTGIPEDVRPLLSAAERLGVWLSGLTLYETSLLLKVVF